MRLHSYQELEKLNLNKYEAVIVAAQHARRLNSRRLKQLERMGEDPTVIVEPRKITMLALGDLIDGRVKFTREDSM